jgi:hypothetical protein
VAAAKPITFGPDAAMSTGTAGCVARSSHRKRLSKPLRSTASPFR